MPTTEELQVQIDVLEQEKAELAERAKLGDAYLKDLRDEVLRLAGLVLTKDGTLPESVAKLIKDAGLLALKDLKELYQEQADEMFPLVCQDCGSSNVERRSSRETQREAFNESVKVDEFKG